MPGIKLHTHILTHHENLIICLALDGERQKQIRELSKSMHLDPHSSATIEAMVVFAENERAFKDSNFTVLDECVEASLETMFGWF